MKNKTKRDQIQKKKNFNKKDKPQKDSIVKKSQYSSNWFYMTTEEVNVKDIKNAITDQENDIEIWEEAQILEINMKEAKSIDIEKMRGTFHDEAGKEFLSSNGVNTIFMVTIDPDNFVDVKKIMKQIVNKLGGFFCEDVEELKPFNL